MKIKRKIISVAKILVDITMLIIFLFLMSFHLLESNTHEVIGVVIFILFIIHNALNYKWFKNLFKGKYNCLRIVQTSMNLILIICMICCIFSSILISGYVFSFIETNLVRVGRSIHLTSTMWTFIFMSLHLGFHLFTMINRIAFKLKNKKLLKTLKAIMIVLIIVICSFSLYTLWVRKIWEELFLLTEFKWFDYDKTLVVYLLENLSIVVFFAAITYYLRKLIINYYKKRIE